MSRDRRLIPGQSIIDMIATMHERSNGLGGGFAAYGIYPDQAEYYAFHLMYQKESARLETEELLENRAVVVKEEAIPVRSHPELSRGPLLWRYFLEIPRSKLEGQTEEDYVVALVMDINTRVPGAFVFSSGKNMGTFKALGYPEEVGVFYRLDDYEAYIWTSHGRFPTNSPGWWGGAHPFSLLQWSVVHNGELSSYGINKRYLEMYGYQCTLLTDTEVVVYMLDLLVRKHGLSLDTACLALAPPFWKDIDSMDPDAREALGALRMVYGSAFLNGPFSIIVGHPGGMIGITDRIMLRPLVAAERGDLLFLASEEAAIRTVCPEPQRIWSPSGGVPIRGSLAVEVV